MRYAYYPGCSLHSSAKEYNRSTRAVCGALGIELSEIPGWVCCGASSAHMTSELLGLALPVKNLILAKGLGLDVVACCAACYARLKVANSTMSAPQDACSLKVDALVETPYRGEVKVRHLLEVLADEKGLATLREQAGERLRGLRVAAYYGCLLVRPPKVVEFDDPENPMLMDNLIAALGAEPVDWPYKTECCGGSLSLTRTDVVLKLCRDILQMAADEGADCLAVACPLCQSNLDLRQSQVNRCYGADLNLPILYFTQLVGLGLGIRPKELGLDTLIVSPKDLLRARAIA